jgi:hypothetical protein
MVATSRSAALRRAGSFLTLLAFEVAAVVVLTRLGSIPELRIPWHNLSPWLLSSPVEDVLAAVLRSIALLIAWWLLGSNLLYLLASLTRVPSAIRAARWLTLPIVRRATDHALALTLATSLMGAGTGTAVAGATPVAVTAPQRPGPVAAGHQTKAEAAGPLAYAPRPARPPREEAPTAGPPGEEAPTPNPYAARYLPDQARLTQQTTQTTQRQPGYVPRPAGNPPAAQPTPTTSATGPTSTTGQPATTTTGPPTTRPPSTTGTPGTSATSTAPSSTAAPSTAGPPGAGTPPSTTAYVPRPAGPPSTTASSSTTPRASAPGSSAPGSSAPRSSAPGTRPPTTTTPPTTTGPPGGVQQPAPGPQGPGPKQPATHRVVQGDNLWTISRDHLAAVRNRPASDLSEHEIASYWLRVIAVNRSSLRSGDPDLIFPGELIMFPPVGGS